MARRVRPLEWRSTSAPADLLDLGLPSDVGTGAGPLGTSRPPCLRVEVSEDAVMSDPDRDSRCSASCARIGVATALDDFGAGHVSLS